MASEPIPSIPSMPENLSDDVPADVDFTAVMARAQAQLIHFTGLNYSSNEDMTQKLRAFGLEKAAQ